MHVMNENELFVSNHQTGFLLSNEFIFLDSYFFILLDIIEVLIEVLNARKNKTIPDVFNLRVLINATMESAVKIYELDIGCFLGFV